MKFIDFLKETNVSGDIQGVQTKLDKKLYRYPENEVLDSYELEDEEDDLIDVVFWIVQHFYHQSPQQIHEYAKILFDLYYDHEDYDEEFTFEDIVWIIVELLEDGVDEEDILDDLEIEMTSPLSDEEAIEIYDQIEDVLYSDEFGDLEERVSPLFKQKNYNKKRRKFMAKSKAVMNRERVKRRQKNRQTKVKRRQKYRANRNRIKLYQKQYRRAVKTGLHRKKLRRRVG